LRETGFDERLLEIRRIPSYRSDISHRSIRDFAILPVEAHWPSNGTAIQVFDQRGAERYC
jgi:hypothetical protein